MLQKTSHVEKPRTKVGRMCLEITRSCKVAKTIRQAAVREYREGEGLKKMQTKDETKNHLGVDWSVTQQIPEGKRSAEKNAKNQKTKNKQKTTKKTKTTKKKEKRKKREKKNKNKPQAGEVW